MSHLQLTRQARHVDRHRLTSRDRSSSAPHLYLLSFDFEPAAELAGVWVSGLVWGRDRKRHAHNIYAYTLVLRQISMSHCVSSRISYLLYVGKIREFDKRNAYTGWKSGELTL